MPVPPDVRPEGWSAVAESYEADISPFTSLYAGDALRVARVAPRERVLDVAAGAGAFSLLAARLGASVLATDFSPEMVARLKARLSRERVPNVDARVMDGQALSLPDESFDVAGSVFGLIFFPDRVRGFREMWRVLKPGGRAVIAAWSVPERVMVISPFTSSVREALPLLPRPSAPPPVFSLADPKRIESEMGEAGFRDVRIESVTHEWRYRSAMDAWTRLTRGSPVFHSVSEGLSPVERERVRETLVAKLVAEFGAGPIGLPSEAHVAVGTK